MSRRPSCITVRCPWEVDGLEYTVIAEVTFGWPGRGPSFDSPGEPPDGDEVDVLCVEDEERNEYPELLQMACDDEILIDQIAECAREDALDRWADEQERKADERAGR